jgi:hypothetical protein
MSIIKFNLINLIFPSFLNDFVLTINSFDFHFKRVENYYEIIESLKRNYASQITCSAEIEFPPTFKTNEVINSMSKINHLLTFCRGTIINYKSYEINGNRVTIDPISTDFAYPGLIDENDIESTTRFIQNGFDKFDELDNTYTLRKIAREYAYTRRNNSFLTVRAYVATILIEYLISKYLETIDYEEYIIKESAWIAKNKKLKEEFRKLLSNIFTSAEARPKEIKGLSSKIDFLNEKALNRKIKTFAKDHNLIFDIKEINRLVKIRNELVHESSFLSEENKFSDFYFVLNFLDKMLLGLFKYEGMYFNYMDQTYHQQSYNTS